MESCVSSHLWNGDLKHTVERDHERGEVYSNEERQEREWNHENKENQQDGMRMRGERRHKTPKV